MKSDVPSPQPTPDATAAHPRPAKPILGPTPEGPLTDFMILPDGTVYARNLTPELAAILADLNPHDSSMAFRAAASSL